MLSTQSYMQRLRPPLSHTHVSNYSNACGFAWFVAGGWGLLFSLFCFWRIGGRRRCIYGVLDNMINLYPLGCAGCMPALPLRCYTRWLHFGLAPTMLHALVACRPCPYDATCAGCISALPLRCYMRWLHLGLAPTGHT